MGEDKAQTQTACLCWPHLVQSSQLGLEMGERYESCRVSVLMRVKYVAPIKGGQKMIANTTTDLLQDGFKLKESNFLSHTECMKQCCKDY